MVISIVGLVVARRGLVGHGIARDGPVGLARL
jgi:hypothetical protein